MRIATLFCMLVLAITCVAADEPAAAPAARSEARFHQLLREMLKLPSGQQAQGTPAFDALSAKLDAEAAQKDAWRTGLFWYTDLNDALAVAKRTGKPVLSLRLLGRLDEELSCANSRFFRKMLYVDPDIRKLMRENFVLHWESLRPVPTVTIDFGNGRTIKRTVTGNSIHYVLLPDGRVMDALPGLVDQKTFLAELQSCAAFAATPSINDDQLNAYWKRTIERLTDPTVQAKVDAAVDQSRAMSKVRIERPTIRNLRSPTAELVADTNQNQHEIRPKILGFLAAGEGKELPKMNKRVYAELFLSPLDDPDMGLNPADEVALFADAPSRVVYP
jgi:hypothetical protein